MTKEEIIEELKVMPLWKTMKLKIGENEEGLRFVREHCGFPDATMEDVRRHNEDCKQWENGFAAAMEEIRKWRNALYLKIMDL